MNQKTVLITGTSSGFGYLATALLVQRGHRVTATLRGGRRRFESIVESETQYGPILKNALVEGRLQAVDLHLEDPIRFESGVVLLKEMLGDEGLDVLINNAGYGLLKPTLMQTEKELREQMEVNFFAPVFLAKKLFPLVQKKNGKIINVSSILGMVSLPYYSAYCASKFALEAMTESLFYEANRLGVQLALVEPGGFNTQFTNNAADRIQTHQEDSRYGRSLERFFGMMSANKDRAPDPIQVARLLIKLTEKKKIKLRYIVGKDALALRLVQRMIPDRLRTNITAWLTDKFFIKNP